MGQVLPAAGGKRERARASELDAERPFHPFYLKNVGFVAIQPFSWPRTLTTDIRSSTVFLSASGRHEHISVTDTK